MRDIAEKQKQKPIYRDCAETIIPLRDALDVFNGKWKILNFVLEEKTLLKVFSYIKRR